MGMGKLTIKRTAIIREGFLLRLQPRRRRRPDEVRRARPERALRPQVAQGGVPGLGRQRADRRGHRQERRAALLVLLLVRGRGEREVVGGVPPRRLRPLSHAGGPQAAEGRPLPAPHPGGRHPGEAGRGGGAGGQAGDLPRLAVAGMCILQCRSLDFERKMQGQFSFERAFQDSILLKKFVSFYSLSVSGVLRI